MMVGAKLCMRIKRSRITVDEIRIVVKSAAATRRTVFLEIDQVLRRRSRAFAADDQAAIEVGLLEARLVVCHLATSDDLGGAITIPPALVGRTPRLWTSR